VRLIHESTLPYSGGAEMAETAAQITGGRLLARNTVLNLVGYGAPMVAALVAIPLLIAGLGAERFGVLAVAWATIGYFSVFDLGIGRAVTQIVAARLGTEERARVPEAAWTGFALLALLGAVAMLAVAVLSPWLVREILTIPAALQAETLTAFYLLAASLPFVTSTAGLRGVLEAYQRFGVITAVRVPMGVLTFAGPLLVLPFSVSLVPVVAVLVVGRCIGWAVHFGLCLWAVPSLRFRVVIRADEARTLAGYGGWITVSNLASTVMAYFDRFLIGAVISMAAVAYYVTPHEMVTKLLFLPGALLGVMFPAFATSFAADRARMVLLLDRAIRVLIVGLFPVTLLAVTFAGEALQLWLGAEFAHESRRVLQWLAVGVFVNSLGQVPASALQGVGRPDLPGKLNLVELPLYLGALWWLLGAYGIEGAAAAWVLRAAVDTAMLCWLAERVASTGGVVPRRMTGLAVTGLVLFGCALIPESIVAKVAFAGTILPLLAWLAWSRMLSPEERGMIRRWAPKRDLPASVPGAP
jgi:O-antigen/teichoic acid export membrane protein